MKTQELHLGKYSNEEMDQSKNTKDTTNDDEGTIDIFALDDLDLPEGLKSIDDN